MPNNPKNSPSSTNQINTHTIRALIGLPPRKYKINISYGEIPDKLDRAMEKITRVAHAGYSREDIALLLKAYRFARRAHDGQIRRSGEAFITHPIAVTYILAELGLDADTLAASLLHDTVEDTDVKYEDIVEEFGEVIANMVDGVTKLTRLEYGEDAPAETIRKMIVAMSRDIRVLVIKLADRLHNARTWKYMLAESAAKKAKETLEIYAPLAHRLGLNQIKRELEDLSFEALYPKVYQEIEQLVAQYAPQRDVLLSTVMSEVNDIMDAAKIKAVVTGRPKHFYSVYQKMIVRGRNFENIYDLIGIRIIVDTVAECYGALGAVHSRWNHIPGRFKDYIAMPKYNMYQSLHTTVLGPEGRKIEIQIRTHDMHHFAQYGVAAHWKYKEMAKGAKGKKGDRAEGEMGGRRIPTQDEMPWIKQIVEWQSETKDSTEFLDALRFDLNSDEVFVFTPKGSVLTLPKGSTPIDFAYSVHTEVGHKTMGSRVNGRLVPLDSELQSGDTVDILTTKAQTAGPSRDWLNFAKSPRARNKIRQWFTKSRREESVEMGKNDLATALKGQNLPLRRTLSHQTLVDTADDMGYDSVDTLYASIGEGLISPANVIGHIVKLIGNDIVDEIVDEKIQDAKHIRDSVLTPTSVGDAQPINPGISVSGNEGENDVWIKLAKCCTPVPGDVIIGFVTKGNGVSIHRQDCFNVAVLRESEPPEKFIDASWIQGANTSFLVNIQVEALDRSHLLSDVTRVLSDNDVNILSGSVETTRDRVALSRWVFEIGDPQHLATVLSSIRKIEGVLDVYRLTGKRTDATPHIRA